MLVHREEHAIPCFLKEHRDPSSFQRASTAGPGPQAPLSWANGKSETPKGKPTNQHEETERMLETEGEREESTPSDQHTCVHSFVPCFTHTH